MKKEQWIRLLLTIFWLLIALAVVGFLIYSRLTLLE